LKKNGIRVFEDRSGQRREVNPNNVDWSGSGENFRYHLNQKSGPRNPLGRIKFYFANQCDCYLHDTPSQSLFENTDRALSHGCIRVEQAPDLAAYLLRGNPVWTLESILAAIQRGTRINIDVSERVPIYLVYFTAWEDEYGIQFRRDLYGQDKLLLEMLHRLRR